MDNNVIGHIFPLSDNKLLTADNVDSLKRVLRNVSEKTQENLNNLSIKAQYSKNKVQVQEEINQNIIKWTEQVKKLGGIPLTLFKVKLKLDDGTFFEWHLNN